MPITDQEWDAICDNAVTQDEYNFSKIGFVPDVIYDIGADVGSITLAAHKLFPETRIIAVEPNPISYPMLEKRVAGIPQITPVNAAVGQGPMYEPLVNNPLHWSVVEADAPSRVETWPEASVPSVTLDELYKTYGGERYAVKIDCEGAEYGITQHAESRAMICGSAYFAAELHFWGRTNAHMYAAVEWLRRFMFDLAQTHTVYSYAYGACEHVWAKRRDESGSVREWMKGE